MIIKRLFFTVIGLATTIASFGVADAGEPIAWTVNEDLRVAPAEIITTGSVTQVQRGWKYFSGEWKHAADALRGEQRATERRGAQAVCVMPCDDAVVEFKVRLEGCKMVQFRWQDAIPEHICRVIIKPDGFSVQKDDHDHAGPDVNVPLGKAALELNDGQWHAVRVELRGKRIQVTIDDRSISGEHEMIAAPKHFFEFIVSGTAASFRNVRAQALKRSP